METQAPPSFLLLLYSVKTFFLDKHFLPYSNNFLKKIITISRSPEDIITETCAKYSSEAVNTFMHRYDNQHQKTTVLCSFAAKRSHPAEILEHAHTEIYLSYLWLMVLTLTDQQTKKWLDGMRGCGDSPITQGSERVEDFLTNLTTFGVYGAKRLAVHLDYRASTSQWTRHKITRYW